MKVVVVDDDAELCELLARALTREQHEVITYGSLAQVQAALAREHPDVLILDLDLPDGSGLDLCSALRRERATMPILILSASGDVSARITGLDAGADDYLVKPFAVAELRARVRALGRRRERKPKQLAHGDVRLDFDLRRAWRLDLEVLLTAREWAILEALAEAEGRVVAREALLTGAWGEANEANSASLDVLLARIRRKLGRSLIRTVRGEGHALG
jgi:two-component system OmpR family response regulator